MHNTRRFISIISVISFFILLILVSHFKVTSIIGSQKAYFSGLNLVMPVSAFLGWAAPFLLVGWRLLFTKTSLFIFLLHHIPGLCGAWYWRSTHLGIRFLLPLACMVLFLLHPVGMLAYGYSFFWLIPLVIYVMQWQGLIGTALGATFVTHAVGSVIWLYTMSISAEQWWALIPIVCIERVVSVIGIVLMLRLHERIVNFIKHSVTTFVVETKA